MRAYKHFVDPVPLNPDFEKDLTYVLLTSVDELKKTFVPDSYMAWDLETSSLNAEEGFIVGFSYTYDGKTGYYCPVNHCDIALGPESLKVFYKMIKLSKCSLLYNARFDMRFMEFAGFDLLGIQYIDVMNIVWLSDTNIPMPSLKKAETHFLGWQAPKFEETLGSAMTFQFVPAKQAYRYACLDCLGTFLLLPRVIGYYRESKLAAKLDNEALFVFMRLENQVQRLDLPYLETLTKSTYDHIITLERNLYKMAGYQFKIGSGKDLTQVFMQMGIDTGQRTKAGLMQTSIPVIDNYMKRNPGNEFLRMLIEYKQTFKFLGSYVEKFLEIAKAGKARFSYKLQSAPTGRTASGADAKNSFFSPMNVQSVPKPHMMHYYPVKASPEQVANREDILGWVFNEEGTGAYVEGYSPLLNVRRALVPAPDAYCVSVDMKAEELRVVANAFREPTWIAAFNSGADIHRTTAEKIFGKENYSAENRNRAKVASFGILYGSEAMGFNERFPDMTFEECEEFIFKFKRALPNIITGQQRAIKAAKKDGSTYTYFGRPRRVKYYFTSPEPRDRAFGCRTVQNTLVQGAAADVLKLIMCRLWKEVFLKYPTVEFMSTIHDEVNFSVPRDLASEVIPIILQCMTVKLADWPVVLECSLDVGDSWGSIYPFDFKDGKFTPSFENPKEEVVPLKIAEPVDEPQVYDERMFSF